MFKISSQDGQDHIRGCDLMFSIGRDILDATVMSRFQMRQEKRAEKEEHQRLATKKLEGKCNSSIHKVMT